MAVSSKTAIFRVLRFLGGVPKAMMFLGSGLICCMAVVTFIHVVGRYGFNHPILGQNEIVGFLQAAAISVSGAYTLLQLGHIAIGIIVDRLSAKTQLICDILVYIASLGFAIIAFLAFIESTSSMVEQSKHTRSIGIPLAPLSGWMAFAWLLLSVCTVWIIADRIRRLVKR